MFKMYGRTIRGRVFVGLAACIVLFSSANPGVGEARPLLATAPVLVAAKSFAVLGGSTVTNVPAAGTVVSGDLGVWPGLAITGFPPGIVVPPGVIHAGDAVAQSAQSDVTAAYNSIGSASQPCPGGNVLTGQDLGGKTLLPGVYCFSSSAQLTGILTLNGTNTDVWIFQIGTTLTTASNSSVAFVGGATNACNVFWQVGTSATLGTSTAFNGNILALSSITMNHGANIGSGRALARNGAVTLDDNRIDAHLCSGTTPGGVGASAIFSPAAITVGGVASKIFSLSNANAGAATITTFTDNLPSGMVIATPSGASNTCGGTLSAPTGGSTVTMTGGTIPAGPGVCTITVNVTAVTLGNKTNTLPAGALVTLSGSSPNSTSSVLSVSAAPAAPAAASAPREVPEADTLLLFGSGIGGLATFLGWQWRMVRSKSR